MRAIFKFLLLAVWVTFCTAPVALADINIMIDKHGGSYYRHGAESISGTIFRVKRDVLKVTVDGHWGEVDMSAIKFSGRLRNIFSEGMVVQLEGTYKYSNAFRAVAVTLSKGGKTYMYRSKVSAKAPYLYRLFD